MQIPDPIGVFGWDTIMERVARVRNAPVEAVAIGHGQRNSSSDPSSDAVAKVRLFSARPPEMLRMITSMNTKNRRLTDEA